MNRVARFLLRPRGDRRWDLVLRATGIVALAGIPVVYWVPRSVVLVWLAVISLPANSPLSPILPASFEPVIMEAAKFEPALAVTVVALAAYMYTEYLNYHLYAWVLNWQRFSGLRGRRWVRWGVERFARAPYTTIVIFALTPLPFWIARCLSILHRYPLTRFMSATAVGRLPRIFAYAWLGAKLQVPGLVLLGVAVGSAAMVVAWRLARGQAVLSETVLDAEARGNAPRP